MALGCRFLGDWYRREVELVKGQIELRARREALMISQAELAKLIGTRQATVSRWETVPGRLPNALQRHKISALLGIHTTRWIMDHEAREISLMLAASRRLRRRRARILERT
jgi:transcriptional regulator with XRE-family HTH domain